MFVLEDEVHDLPLIKDVLARHSGYNYVTILDLTSQFYHFVIVPYSLISTSS